MEALLLGCVAAGPSYAFIVWRTGTRLDESLDVLAAHGLGGIVGTLWIGLFAEESWNGIADGLFHGNAAQLGKQALAVVVAIGWSFGASFVLLRALALVVPLRVPKRDEGLGLDVVEHGEEAYTTGEGAILIREHPLETPAPAVAVAGAPRA
jgi:Amt family ammonium transporter